jgi:hypothetical protein
MLLEIDSTIVSIVLSDIPGSAVIYVLISDLTVDNLPLFS